MRQLAFGILMGLFLSLSFSPAFAEPQEDQSIRVALEEQYRDAKSIHARFNDRFYWDTSDRVRVEVQDGVVTLRGIVQTDKARHAFIQIARETAGVKEVIEKIRVIPSARKVD